MNSVNVQVQNYSDARRLGQLNHLLSDSLSRLSSGTRIAKPSEDPTAVGTGGKLSAQNRRAQAAAVNVQNAVSLTQTSAGFLANIGTILSRMAELGQSATDPTKSSNDVALYQTEFRQLQDQLRQTVGGSTAEIVGTSAVSEPLGTFNGVVLFGANPAGITVASGSQAGIGLVIPETNLRAGALSDLFRQDSAGNYLVQVTDANIVPSLEAANSGIADARSVLAGVSSRLDFAAGRLAVESENLEAAVSRIADTDIATESTRLSKLNLLYETGTAMLSQANQSPKTVLRLLQI